MASQTRSLLLEGFPIELVRQVARELGRNGEFPGFLQERVRKAPPYCLNGSGPKGNLTVAQLRRCNCEASCRRWAELKEKPPG